VVFACWHFFFAIKGIAKLTARCIFANSAVISARAFSASESLSGESVDVRPEGMLGEFTGGFCYGGEGGVDRGLRAGRNVDR
jgi:hypothetical protein